VSAVRAGGAGERSGSVTRDGESPARVGGAEEVDERWLGHMNLIAQSAASTRWSHNGKAEEADDVVLYASGSWIPAEFNGAFRTDDGVPGTEVLARADRFFGGVGRGYTVKVRDDGSDEDLRAACAAAGIAPFGDPAPQMVCRARPPDEAPPEGIEVRVVRTEQEVEDFVAVNADAYGTYGLPGEEMAAVFTDPQGVLATDDAVLVVAYEGATPLAAALTYLSHGISGLYFVGTVEAARQRGLGRCIALAATHQGFDRGGRICILQASPMGAPIYLKMGYETLYHYLDHIRWEPPDS
jgi:Acetyltransferase (GNAT) domain